MIKLIIFNEKLKRKIDSKGMKSNFIADKAGIDTSIFSRILNGVQNATMEQAVAIAGVLNCKVQDIF